jgi:hypothetical protein
LSLAVININDAGIQIAVDGDLMRTSPGFAVLDVDKLMVGEAAVQHAKLLPRWTNNRFWSQLTTTPLSNGTPDIRHHADLAFAHLEDVWLPLAEQTDQVIFIVPGYYTAENLGLLLGMAKECRLPVKGVVDNSVMVASNLPLRQVVLHLDIHLHSITLTRLSNTGSLVRKDVKTILETGLATLWDRWAAIIANQFIQTTRFDPMHDADSEQQLFNQLPDWIGKLGQDNMHSFELATGSAEHTVAVSHDSLLRACTPLYPQIVQAIRSEVPAGEEASLLVSHHFSGFPGLKDSLKLIPEVEAFDLNEMKSIGSAQLHREKLTSETGSIAHIVQLDSGELSTDMGTLRRAPTHLLWQNHAYAIGSGFKLGSDLSKGPRQSEQPVCTFYPRNQELIMDCHEPNGIRINDQPPEHSNKLQPGDRIEVLGESLITISVSADG